jgi:hypothetical protein
MLRRILAFLLAPLPAALLQAAIVALWGTQGASNYEHPSTMFVAMCLFLYVPGLVLGVPLYLALRRRTPNRLRSYALAGMLIVLIPMTLLIGSAAPYSPIPAPSRWREAIILLRYAVSGLLTGATFWLLARPDRCEARRLAAAEKTRLAGAFE